MEKLPTPLPGCFELRPRRLEDARGHFVKTFNRDTFASLGLRTDWAEQYYSVSRHGVLRGLHFQEPPEDHAKLIYCTAGTVWDVALDLRRGSPTYGRSWHLQLAATTGNMLYLPAGLAHGFYTLSDEATVVYNVTSGYSPKHDKGILWNSADIPWPEPNPLLSERDHAFPRLADFSSPFSYDSNEAGK